MAFPATGIPGEAMGASRSQLACPATRHLRPNGRHSPLPGHAPYSSGPYGRRAWAQVMAGIAKTTSFCPGAEGLSHFIDEEATTGPAPPKLRLPRAGDCPWAGEAERS